MKRITLYLFSIEYLDHSNGVDRHTQVFVESLRHYKHIECMYFAFIADASLFGLQEIKTNYNCKKVLIPLPNNSTKVFNNAGALFSFNKEVRNILRAYFIGKKNRILHVHTLNLMPLALLLRSRYKCKIISHIHSIAWKYNIDWNPKKFFCLLNSRENNQQRLFVIGEYEAYNYADAVICVSKCGEAFVRQMQDTHTPPIYIIPNGLPDTFQLGIEENLDASNNTFNIVFVGGTSKSKGLIFLLDAIKKLPSNISNIIKIIIAGKTSTNEIAYIRKQYNNLNLIFTGWLHHDKLENIYKCADLGAIMSLHEQCSYAAIEMMMHQLPIISTNADGLVEMFKHRDNAILVPIIYNHNTNDVRPDSKILIDSLTLLINDPYLRTKISERGRATYLEKYTISKMTEQLISLYFNLIDNETRNFHINARV